MHEENYQVISSFERNNWWYRAKRNLFKSLLTKIGKKFDKALDLGCGVGSNFEVLSAFADKIVGIDYTESALSRCREKHYTSLHKMDATRLTFETNSFDLILCSDVLEHIDDSKAIHEITRVLKPGGIFIFSVPAHSYLWGPTDIISKHVKRYEKKDLDILLGEDYKIRKLSYWNMFMLIPDLVFIKLLKFVNKHHQEKNALEFIPSALNNLLYTILWLENKWFIRFNNPNGVSIVGVAQKYARKNR